MSTKKGAATQMRTTVINRSQSVRSSMSRPVSRSSSLRVSMGFQSVVEGMLPKLSRTAVGDVLDVKAKEKQEMQGLNERFASYIEQVRFLQAQNKALLVDNERLKGQKGFDASSIKEIYEQELTSCKQVIEELSNEKASFDAKMVGLQDLLDTEKRERAESDKIIAELRNKIDGLNTQIAEYEGEITTLRAHIDSFESESMSMKTRMKRVEEDCYRLRSDLDEETVKRIEAENGKQTVWEDYQFHLSICDAEITELRALLDKDKQIEIGNIWKGELSKAIAEIQEEYDRQLVIIRTDLQTRMEFQMSQIEAGINKENSQLLHSKEESRTLKLRIDTMLKQINDLEAENYKFKTQLQLAMEERDQLQMIYDAEARKWALEMEESSARFEAIRKELMALEDVKLSLEMEISVYRKLLDGEEIKIQNYQTLQSMAQQSTIQQSVTQQKSGLQRQQTSRDTRTGKLVIKRAKRGPVQIAEVSPDGICVTLKNGSEKVQNLNGWKITRIGGTNEEIQFILPDITLQPEGIYSIYGNGYQGELKENEVKAEFFSWGAGDGEYKLFDTESETPKSTLEMDFDI